jgi:hypothetical protein
MRVPCVLLRRKFLARIEGELWRADAERLDEHLIGCRKCRDLFERVRAGHEAGRRFGRLRPNPPPRLPEFEEIGADRRATPPARTLAPSAGAWIILAAAAFGLGFLVLSKGILVIGPPADGFTPLAISEFATNTRNRIVTEGFVHNVYFDAEEQTLHIKLVEGPLKAEPFVICEIRDPRGVTIPEEGNRIRVFGTARYDGQPGRGWHEVNPVAEIAVLKH